MLDDLASTSVHEAPVEKISKEFSELSSSSDEKGLENVSLEFTDYDLIEMFLDLILMVKIDETLSPSIPSNNMTDESNTIFVSKAITASSTISTPSALQTRVIKLSKEGTTNV